MNRYELERTLSQGGFSLKKEGLGVALRAALSAAPESRQRRVSAIRLQSLTRRAAVAGLFDDEAPLGWARLRRYPFTATAAGPSRRSLHSLHRHLRPGFARGILDRQLARTVMLLGRVIVSGLPTPALRRRDRSEAHTSARGRWMGLAVEGQGRLTRLAGSPPFSRLARRPTAAIVVFPGFLRQPRPRRPRMDWV